MNVECLFVWNGRRNIEITINIIIIDTRHTLHYLMPKTLFSFIFYVCARAVGGVAQQCACRQKKQKVRCVRRIEARGVQRRQAMVAGV